MVFRAIILTIICEYITLNDDVLSNLQIDSWGRVVRYGASFFFVNRYWFVGDLEPVWNSPFWSLSYEATYYVAAALIIFGNRKICAFGLVILALLAGPSIVVLAPIWFLGYGTYFYSRRRRFGPLLGLFLWFASVGVLPFASLFNEVKSLDIPVLPNRFHGTIGSLLADYTAGIAFAVHLISFQSFESKVKPALLRFQNTLRWLGSLTFVLYLFHLPLLKLFSFYSVGGPGSSIERIWVLGGTLLTVAVIGPFIERSKIYYRRAALWALQHMPMTRYRIQAVQEMLRTD